MPTLADFEYCLDVLRQLSENMDAYLTDFGMSLYLHRNSPPTEGLGLGTTVYNAPELVRASPHAFGFPVDVYAFGVTLNVFLTGREPYYNCRSPVEQMLWVSRGAYWEWETRRKLSEIGAHHGRVASSEGRSTPGSIRSFKLYHQDGNVSVDSIDSMHNVVRASPSIGGSSRGPSARAVACLLADEIGSELSLVQRPISSLAAEDDSDDDSGPPYSPSLSQDHSEQASSAFRSYSDGSPVQYFLSGTDPVPEGILRLLQRMTCPDPAGRPTMQEVVNALQVF